MALALSNLHIRTRLYSGFGLLIALALVLAAFGANRLWDVGNNLAAMTVAAEQTGEVDRITEQVETIRRATLRFFSDGDREALAQVRAATEQVRRLIKQAADHGASEQARKVYQGLAEELEAYNAQALSMFVMRDVVTGERGKLVDVGNRLSQATERVVKQAQVGQDISVAFLAGEVSTAVLDMRLPAWKFLATVDPEFVTALKTAHDEAQKAVLRLDQVADDATRANIATMKAVLTDYAANFDVLSQTMLANKQLYYQQMVPTIVKLQGHLADWSKTLDARFDAARKASTDTIATASTLQIVAAGIALVIGVLAAFFLGRSIANPLGAMTATMHQLAGGDTAVTVPSLEATDEVGEMARAVEVFKANMIRNAELAAAQQQEQARKEARQRAVDNHIAGFDQSVRDMLHMLASAATEMQAAAQSMSQTANQTNEQAATMAAAAEQASANVQTMAAATEEMAASATEISHQVSRSAQITARAVESARHTDHQVQSLSEAAQRIEDVVAIINGIAGQTNLLALNATIEAARAGDAGKGFAVVASEVKALAGQTGKATEEIGAQIQAIQTATKEAVEAIKAISATINEVNDISTAIAAAMEEQGATTGQMTRNTQEAAKGTQDVSSTIAGVSQGANATGAAASQVLAAAGELGKQAETLRVEVDGFLDKIRAA